jgi:hypothetical protein
MNPQAADSWEDLLSDEEDKKEKAAAAAAADAKAKAAAAGAAEDEESSSEEDDGEDDETSEDEGMGPLGFWAVTWVYVIGELGCTCLARLVWWCLLGAWLDLLLLHQDPAGNECNDDDEGCTRLGNVCVGSSSSKRIERAAVKSAMAKMMRPAKMKVCNPWGVKPPSCIVRDFVNSMNCVGTGGARVGSVC